MMSLEQSKKKNGLIYGIIIGFTFLLFGNTLNHQYALDDAIVITENEYVLNGFDGIPGIFSQELFNGFFEEKNKDLVAGGRYRPISLLTFAVEYELIMGSPFETIDAADLESRLNQGHLDKNKISPFQKLNKELNKSLISYDVKNIQKNQQVILNKYDIHEEEKTSILMQMEKMQNHLPWHQFVSHFINVLLFALTGLVLFLLLALLFNNHHSSPWYLTLPFIVTMLFIAHPIHTEVVANIKGRDEILAFLTSLWAMYLALKYVDTKKLKFLFWTFIIFLIAVFSKEVAVTFIAIIPVAIWFFRGGKWKEMGVSILPILAASFMYLFIRNQYVEGISSIAVHESSEIMNNSFYGMNVMTKYATILYSLLLYLKLLIFPHPLTYDYYPYHIAAQSWDFWPIISLVVYMSLAAYAIYGLIKRQPIAFGIIFFAISLAPTSNILFSIGAFMNERFIYGASLGFSIITGYLILVKLPILLKETRARNTIIFGLILLLLGLYSYKTMERNKAWENDFVLMTTDVKTSSKSAKSNCSAAGKIIEYAENLEDVQSKSKNLKQAISYLHKAIQIHPRYLDAYILMGNAHFQLNKNLDSTFYFYNKVLEISPNNQVILDNLFNSNILLEYNTPQQSVNVVNGLETMYPYLKDRWQANYYLGRMYGRYQNNMTKAIEYLSLAKSQNPSSVMVLEDLGVAYGISGNYLQSAICFQQAIKFEPQNINLNFNAINSLYLSGDKEKALDYCSRLQGFSINNNDVNTLHTLVGIYQNMGENKLAERLSAKLIELNK